ncbi:unnamed protein product [Symbiodinium sp. KB8]|nr:unnamed protein product [Symbiodinium sp. KB8]
MDLWDLGILIANRAYQAGRWPEFYKSREIIAEVIAMAEGGDAPQHIQLKVKDQQGSEVQFKHLGWLSGLCNLTGLLFEALTFSSTSPQARIKKTTPLRKLSCGAIALALERSRGLECRRPRSGAMASSKAGLLQPSSPKTDKGDSDTDSEAEAGGGGNCLWLAGRARQVGAKNWVKWLVPFILVGISSVLCMWMLHAATWYYVMGIVRFEKAYTRNPDYKEEHPGLFSNSLHPDEVSYGSLQDPLSARLGYQHVPLKVLDGIALLFPFLWFLTVVYLRDVQQWTKVLLSHSVLAIGKGVFGVVTIMPDSIGWANCKARLGPSGVDFFKNRVPDPNVHGTWTTFMAILGVELAGPEQNRIGAGMRFCADMLYSGHTYFTILYILALCELVRKAIRMPDSPIYVRKPFRQRLGWQWKSGLWYSWQSRGTSS